MSGFCVILCIAVVTAVAWGKDYHNYASHGNSCSLVQNGCTYQVQLVSQDCMVRDDPNPGHGITVVKEASEEKGSKKEIEKLEDLEKRLTKMMEGLSIRSLRHIRHIRNDLRQMSSSMDLLKQQIPSRGKNKRGLECPAKFIGVGTWGSCYRFSSFNTTWHEAREYCNAFGADLVALDTLKESYILDYLIKSNPEFWVYKGWWTGGTYNSRSRRWMWTSRYSILPMRSSRWAPGEPNARTTQHCLILYKYANYRWHDAACSDKHNFICEIQIF